MEFVSQLWMPILISGLVVFILSAVVWIALPHHKSEWQGLPNEDDVLGALGRGNPAPGLYTFPFYRDPKERENPVVKAKIEQGPVGYLTVIPSGVKGMGPMMLQAFIFNVVVACLAAYVAWHALGAGANYLPAFRIVGTVTLMAYTLAIVPESIWFGRPWRSFMLQSADALLYALVSAGIFGWLWPR